MKSIFTAVILSIALGGLILGCSPKSSSGAPAAGDKPAAAPAVPKADATFASALQPIISERCGDCHTEEAKGRFSLLSRDSVLAGGKSGPAVKPGDSENSLLYKMVAGKPGLKRMPPKGNPLTDAQVASIKAWIDGGAK